MKTYQKITGGWIVLFIISFMPIYAWYHFGYEIESVTHALGEIFGLVGMTLFALTFVLSTRISWIEDIFGGLDKVYLTHAALGGLALIFILAHPIFFLF